MEATPSYEGEAQHHDEMAAHARGRAETFRSYLVWCTDPARRRWAEGMAAASEIEADTEAAFADALRATVPA